MPRIGRLHIPGGCYHVMGRGLERRRIFGSDRDKLDFIERLTAGLKETESQCLAWALMPNHYHLLIRVGAGPLSALMGKLLGGYAASYNRHHGRAGYVFQNRYKSILCDEEQYLLELVRYIHLNPLKAKLVKDLRALDGYRWTGHSVLLGKRTNDWQQTTSVLIRFEKRQAQARQVYRQFMKNGLSETAGVDMDGGGLVRSYGGWQRIARLRKEHRCNIGDERILGDSEFVEAVLKQDRIQIDRESRLIREGWDRERLIKAVCGHFLVDPSEITERGRNNALSAAKTVICYMSVRILRLSSNDIAARLRMSQPAVSASIKRGRAHCLDHSLEIEDLLLI